MSRGVGPLRRDGLALPLVWEEGLGHLWRVRDGSAGQAASAGAQPGKAELIQHRGHVGLHGPQLGAGPLQVAQLVGDPAQTVLHMAPMCRDDLRGDVRSSVSKVAGFDKDHPPQDTTVVAIQHDDCPAGAFLCIDNVTSMLLCPGQRDTSELIAGVQSGILP